MPKTYKCEICNYSTVKLYTYNRHLNSKKHLDKEHDVDHPNSCKTTQMMATGHPSNSPSFRFTCEYCKKEYPDKTHKLRHYRSCAYKKAHDDLTKEYEEKLKLERERAEQEKKREQEEKQELEENYKHLEKELMDLLKRVASGDLGSITNNIQNQTNIQNQNNQTINVCYIIKNFNNAKNYYDIMSQPLTEEELEYIKKVGPSEGCANLIKNRCIDPYEIEERPFHCVDTSRVKFILKDANGWQNDLGGKKIYKEAVPKVHEGYMKDAEALEPDELCKRHRKLHSMHKDEKKIMSFIAGKSDCKALQKL